MSKLRKISCACCTWPCLGSSLAALRYLLCTSGLCMTSYLLRQRQRTHSQNDSQGRHRGRSPIFCNCHVRHTTNNNLLFVFFLRCCKELCNEKQFSTKLICRVGRSPVFDGTIRVFWYNVRLTISLKIRQVSKFGILSGIYFNVTLVQRHSIKQHLIKSYLPKAVFRIKKNRFLFRSGLRPEPRWGNDSAPHDLLVHWGGKYLIPSPFSLILPQRIRHLGAWSV